MTGHVHAKLMQEYCNDALEVDKPWERWSYRRKGEEDWKDLSSEVLWNPDYEYLRKKRIININGYEVPEPCRCTLALGTKFYTPIIGSNCTLEYEWQDEPWQLSYLQKGLIHLNVSAAKVHTKALESFTERSK